jgi:hypothetical protein
MELRVAKALYDETKAIISHHDRPEWPKATRYHAEYLQKARAAIRAMRDPTDGMIDAAEELNYGGGIADGGWAEPDKFSDWMEAYEAMIDAASPEVK